MYIEMTDVLTDVTNEVNNATLTITGTKDLTGEGKNQVLLSLTTKDSGANSTTNMSTFADLTYKSLLITVYKNGTSSTNPLEETPLFTRTLQDTQLNKAAINLDITHEETVLEPGVDADGAATTTSRNQFQAGTSYVFDVRFMTTGAVTLIRKIHTFQDAPDASDFTFTVTKGSNSLGLGVNTHSGKPVIKELFVEIIELDGNHEAKRTSGRIDIYSLQKYTKALDTTTDQQDVDFVNNGSNQIIRAGSDNSLPNCTGNLTQAATYNMNIIVVTDGGTSDKIRISDGGSTNLLLSNVPNTPKVTIIDVQKKTNTDGSTANQALGYYLPSILVVYEVTELSAGEVLDRVKLGLTIGGTALSFETSDTYTSTDDDGAYFESDFVTEVTDASGDKRKIIAIRFTKHSSASSSNIIGSELATNNSTISAANYPVSTDISDTSKRGDRTFPQVCQENFVFYSDNGGLGTTIASGGETFSIGVIQAQVTELDFGATVTLDTSVDTFRISNTSVDGTDGNTNLSSNLTTFILQTDTTNTLVETADTTTFTTIDMGITPATSSATETQLTANTFQVTQDELTASGNSQSFKIKSTTDLLSRFVDNNLVKFLVLNMDNNGKKLFTLDTSTGTGRPTAIDFLTGAGELTLTHGTASGAAAQTNILNTYGYVPATAGSNPQMGNTYLAFSTPVSIDFHGVEKISNIYIAVYMEAYEWDKNWYIGPQTVRSELGSLVTGGSIATVTDSTKYNGTASGSGNSGSIASKAASALSSGSNSTLPLQAIFAGTRTFCNSFVSMERTGLIPTVEIIEAEKALLTGNLPEITIKVTENIVLDADYTFEGSSGYALAPYDLSNGDMRPSSMNITLTNISTNASQTFTFTDSTVTTFANLELTAASGVTAGVYQVTLGNGATVNGQAVSLVPGDTFDIYVALGNAYGITAATTAGAAFTRLQTGDPDFLTGIQSTTKPASTLSLKRTSHANSGTAAAEVTQTQLSDFTLFDREVGAPTVTITDQTDVFVGSEEITVNVTANTSDVDDTINYTQLVLEVTTTTSVYNTISTFTYGSTGTKLLSDAGNNLTVNAAGTQYTVRLVDGTTINGTTVSLTAGHTVTVKATLKTGYSAGVQSGATSSTTIQAGARLKTTGTAANYLLTDSGDALDALFDVDLIDGKTTLQFSPAHVNSGVTSPSTWGDLIDTNGISTSDLALTVTPQYETDTDTYDDGVAITITIQNGGNFASLAATTLNLSNDNAQLVAMRARGPSDETTQMKLKFTLTSTFEDDTANTFILTTAAFQPYLHRLTADSITKGIVTYSTAGEQDSLSWTVNYTPETWKSDLSQIKANYRLIKNNISGEHLNLNNLGSSTDNGYLQATDELKTSGLGPTSTTFTKAFKSFARGSGLFPVFTLISLASKGAYAGGNNQHGTITTESLGAAQKLFTRSKGVKNSLIKASSDNTQFLSYVPNGNTIATSFGIDNDVNTSLTVSHVKGTTTGVDKMINNNPQNAIFATTHTITLALANNNQADVALLFDGIHTLNLTLGITTLTQAVTALNALECFPSVINLPGTTTDTPAAVWILGNNVVFKDSSDNVIATANSALNIGDKIELTYEGVKSATSRVSFVTVANAANNTCDFVISTNDTFIPLTSDSTSAVYSFTNGTDAIPLPTLVISQKATGEITHALSVENSANGDTNSLVSTDNFNIS